MAEHAVNTLGAAGARVYVSPAGLPRMCASAGQDSFSADVGDHGTELIRRLLEQTACTAIGQELPRHSQITQENEHQLLPMQALIDGEIVTIGTLVVVDCPRLCLLQPSELERHARALLSAERSAV